MILWVAFEAPNCGVLCQEALCRSCMDLIAQTFEVYKDKIKSRRDLVDLLGSL